MLKLLSCIGLTIAAIALLTMSILAAAGLNPFDVIAGVWGAL